MSKTVKLSQTDIEKIVTNVINEQSEDIADFPTDVDEQSEDIADFPTDVDEQEDSLDFDYEIGGSPDNNKKHLDIFLGKGEDGEIYVVNARTGQVLGHKKP
jgi:hypothetical protein